MQIYIRQALQSDAPSIAPLIYDAIGDIAHRLTGESIKSNVIAALEELVRATDNRHTYLNTFVATNKQEVLGIIVLYSGKIGRELDGILTKKLQKKFSTPIEIDIEAYDDEYYIDTICVAPHARGLGIGTKLLYFAEQHARTLGYKELSLNVEEAKIKARQLYEKQGFVTTEPWKIIGENFYHMVKELQ